MGSAPDGVAPLWAVLYGGNVYACRHCHKQAYGTQRQKADDRATSKADTIRKRLGWEAGILNLPGGKPKGMHWRTFEQLRAAHHAHTNQALAGMAQSWESCAAGGACRTEGIVCRALHNNFNLC